MKVKNIKSFIEFYKNLEITASITNTTRHEATASLQECLAKNKSKKAPIFKEYNKNQSKQKKLEILKSHVKDINCDLYISQ